MRVVDLVRADGFGVRDDDATGANNGFALISWSLWGSSRLDVGRVLIIGMVAEGSSQQSFVLNYASIVLFGLQQAKVLVLEITVLVLMDSQLSRSGYRVPLDQDQEVSRCFCCRSIEMISIICSARLD